MKKSLAAILLVFVIASCKKANDVTIDTSQLINATHLTFVGKDSVDIANYINSSSSTLTIQDSFLITLSSANGFSYLDITIQNDSSVIIFQKSFSQIQGNTIGGSFSFNPQSVYVGDLTYEFTPYNTGGTSGNYLLQTVHLFNSATIPPVIDSVIVPDSVQAAQADTMYLTLYSYVHDPSGISDISKVYFNSTKPDGNPANGNPFAMNYQRQSGNDAVYALTIELLPLSSPTPPQLGTYTFTFYAANRSGAISDSVSHKITVYK